MDVVQGNDKNMQSPSKAKFSPLLGIELGDPLLLEQTDDGYWQRKDRGSWAVATTFGVKRHGKERRKTCSGT